MIETIVLKFFNEVSITSKMENVVDKILDLFYNHILLNTRTEFLKEIIHPEYTPYITIHDPEAAKLDVMDPDLIKLQGINGIKQRILKMATQFNVKKIQILETVHNQQTVIAHYKIDMIHIGTWNNLTPQNAKISTYGFHIFKIKDDLIHSITGMMNNLDILSQLGAAISSRKNNVELHEYLESIKMMLNLQSSEF